MRSALSAQLRPADFIRGRLAAVVCGIYLIGVLVAGIYTIDDAVTVETIGVSFAGLPLLVLTAPLSFVVFPVSGAVLSMLFPSGAGEVPSTVLVVAQSFLIALVQAYVGWLILRGPRHQPRQARPPGAPEPA